MNWGELNPGIVIAGVFLLVFLTAVALFAKGGVDDSDDKTNHNQNNSH